MTGPVSLSLAQVRAAYTSARYPNGQDFEQAVTGTPMTIALRLPGDVDADMHVNMNDLIYMANTWGLSTGEASFDDRCDFDLNGSINVIDLLILADNWGT